MHPSGQGCIPLGCRCAKKRHGAVRGAAVRCAAVRCGGLLEHSHSQFGVGELGPFERFLWQFLGRAQTSGWHEVLGHSGAFNLPKFIEILIPAAGTAVVHFANHHQFNGLENFMET